MAKVFDIALPAHDDEKLTGSIQDSRKQTIAGRPLLSHRNRESIKISRAEIRELRRLLYLYEVSIEELSSVIPVLLRCLVKREIISNKIQSITVISVVIIMGTYMTWGNPNDPKLVFTRIVFITLVGIIASIMGKVWAKTNDEYIRRIKFSTGYPKHAWMVPLLIVVLNWVTQTIHFQLIDMSFSFISFDGFVSGISYHTLMIATAQALIVGMYALLIFRTIRIVIQWRAPELALVRSLADVFEMVAGGNPANWRSISWRSKVAHRIDQAAYVLEGPIARKFSTSAGAAVAAAIDKRFLMAGAALRSKVAWLATPMADTQKFLARALADELLIAVTGDLDRLDHAESEGTGLNTSGLFARLRAMTSWGVFAVGPAIFVVVNNWIELIKDPGAKLLLGQFALISFGVAVLSVADPAGYKDRLGSVIAAGAALSGWRTTERKG
jgi:hypothetical protein